MFLPYFIFQKVITSRVYKFSGCERNLLKKTFLLFVILKNSQLINCISSLSSSLSLSLSFFRFQVICNNIITGCVIAQENISVFRLIYSLIYILEGLKAHTCLNKRRGISIEIHYVRLYSICIKMGMIS